MKNRICCFTGHRTIPEKEYSKIQDRLESEIASLIHQGVKYFATGGALGFDTMAALAILKLKLEFSHIRLILVLPCKNQSSSWNEKDKKIYNQIRENADKVVYTSEHYYNGCMHKRNRHLIDNSGICICYFIKNKSGTAYTIKYAAKKGLRMINLSEPKEAFFCSCSYNGRAW